jgi:hypothetical protein
MSHLVEKQVDVYGTGTSSDTPGEKGERKKGEEL